MAYPEYLGTAIWVLQEMGAIPLPSDHLGGPQPAISLGSGMFTPGESGSAASEEDAVVRQKQPGDVYGSHFKQQ